MECSLCRQALGDSSGRLVAATLVIRLSWFHSAYVQVDLRMVCNLKLMNCVFMEFPTHYFWTIVDHGYLKPMQKRKLQIKGELL
jgi:hypothetical protein